MLDSQAQAWISRINNFTSPIYTNELNINEYLKYGDNLEVESAIGSAFYGPTSKTAPKGCPTGNCTFPSYSTVGICNRCFDVTESLTQECPANILFNATNAKSYSNRNRTTVCNYTLPSGLQYAQYKSNPARGLMKFLAGSVSALLINGTIAGPATIRLIHLSSQIRGAEEWAAEDFRPFVKASECELYPCIREYVGNVTNSELLERQSVSTPLVLHSDRNMMSSMSYLTTDVGCLNGTERNTLLDQGYKLDAMTSNNGTGYMSLNSSDLGGDMHNIRSECLYDAETSIMLPVLNFFQGMNSQKRGKPELPKAGETNYTFLLGFPSLRPFYLYGNDTFQTMNDTMNRIVDSMTTYMRESSTADSNPPVYGQATRLHTCAKVVCTWLALPVVLASFTIYFLIVTILKPALCKGGNYWVSSQLAVLFHGLDKKTRLGLGPLDQMEDMMGKARELKVQLVPTKNGLRLKKRESA